MTTLACAVEDCPLRNGGSCLEAFADPADCPNTSDQEGTVALEPDDDEDLADDVDDLRAAESTTQRLIFFEDGDSLGLSQANDLRAERICRFILIAGEVDAGKSTLLVELFGKFLQRPFEGWDFAGSATLRGFDRVHEPARASSGRDLADTYRTADEGMQFLHLRLSNGRRQDVLLSELSGERFKGVVDGAGISDQVPVAAAADRCLLLIDGELMVAGSTRDKAFRRARRLLGGLTETGGLPPATPTLLLATKADLWRDVASSEVAAGCALLVSFAEERGLRARWESLAARPTDDTEQETGIAPVVAWMLENDVAAAEPEAGQVPSLDGRRFWQDRHD